MTQKLLKEKSSGCVYHWTEQLAQDPGFEPYEPKLKTQPAPEPVVEIAPEPVEPVNEIQQMAQAVLKRRKTK
jgi:hypothetical protein